MGEPGPSPRLRRRRRRPHSGFRAHEARAPGCLCTPVGGRRWWRGDTERGGTPAPSQPRAPCPQFPSGPGTEAGRFAGCYRFLSSAGCVRRLPAPSRPPCQPGHPVTAISAIAAPHPPAFPFWPLPDPPLPRVVRSPSPTQGPAVSLVSWAFPRAQSGPSQGKARELWELGIVGV